MNRACLHVKTLYDWMRKSSTSNGLTASRTFEAPRTFSYHRDSGLRSSKPNMPYSVPLSILVHPRRHLNQHGRFLPSAAGSSWAVPRSMPQRAIVRISWKLGSTSSGQKTGLLSGPRFVLFATLPVFSTSRNSAAEQKQSRVRKVATLAPSGERGRALACPWPDDSCCRSLQPQIPQVLFWHAPNKRAAGQICGKPVNADQHHCFVCRCGGGVDRRHAAVARCLADVIHSHKGTKMYIEQSIPALTRVVNGQVEHARMDLVFDHIGTTTYLDVVQQPSPCCGSQQTTKPHGPESREGQVRSISTCQSCSVHPGQ